MRRREFLTLVGEVTAWPVAAVAQQPAMPVIGLLGFGPPDPSASDVAAFRQGLRELGYIEGRNIRIEYRWAENQTNKLNLLASELVGQRVTVSPPGGVKRRSQPSWPHQQFP